MKILVDCTPLLVRSAGVKSYLFHLCNALLQATPHSAPHQIEFFPRLKSLGQVRVFSSNLSSFPTAWRLGLLQLNLKLKFPIVDWLNKNADLFHASHFMRRLPAGPRITTTLFDLTYRLFPDAHMPANVKLHTRIESELFPRVSGFIAISESTKRDFVEHVGLDEKKIRVIYCGLGEEFREPVSAEKIAQVRREFNLPVRYLMCVATLEPRKNLVRLVQAYAQLPKDLRQECALVLVGGHGWKYREIVAEIENPTLRPSVRYLGVVEKSKLMALLRGAQGFVYPSLYEGFGLPVLEAMACGLPVVSSNVSSLPEVVGDAGLLVDPYSVDEIRNAMQRILTEPTLAASLRERALARAQQFSWKRAAQETLEFFESLA